MSAYYNILEATNVTSRQKHATNLSALCNNLKHSNAICTTYKKFIKWQETQKSFGESYHHNKNSAGETDSTNSEVMQAVEKILCMKDENNYECEAFLKWKSLRVESDLQSHNEHITISTLTTNRVPSTRQNLMKVFASTLPFFFHFKSLKYYYK